MTEMQIDWDAASFESGEDERARREREAMEALSARLAERDAQRGLVPTSEAVFPPDLMPPAQAPQRPLPAPPGMLAAPTPGDLGPSSPPPNPSPLDPGPPAISTSPQPPEPTAEASTNPEAQTSTAGAQAANLRQQAQQQPAPGSVDELMVQERRRMEQEQALQRPTSVHAQPPTAAMPGPTGLPSTRTAPLAPISGQTGIETGAAPALQAMQAQRDEPSFDERREMARDEDVRRRRIRGILMGLAGLMGMRTIGSGGSIGGALPGLIAAGMVRRPDEEETLLEGDERSREIGAQEAEQASVAQRLRQQQEAQAAEERARQERLLFDYRKLQGDEQDRSVRTGLAVNDDQREAAMRDPESRESQMARERFRVALSALPREVVEGLQLRNVDAMSARDIDIIEAELSRNQSARLHGGGGRSGGVAGAAGANAGLRGINTTPRAYVNMIGSRSPELTPEQAEQVAQSYWSQMDDGERRSWLNSTEADRWNSRSIAGYEQIDPTQQMSETSRQRAEEAAVAEEQMLVLEQRILAASENVDNIGGVQELAVRGADAAGVELTDDVSTFNDTRETMISTLNRMAGGGTMDDAEYRRWNAALPTLSDLRGLAGGDVTRRLQAAFDRAKEMARAEMRARGLRRRDEEGQQQPQRQRGVVLRFRAPDGRVRTSQPLAPSAVEAFRRRAVAAGYEEVTQ